MNTLLQVLSEDQRAQVHERTLRVLSRTGVRVDTAMGRAILEEAGAEVDRNTCVVRFPRSLVEESLRSAPKDFTLGARRPGWDQRMNNGDCTLLIDGEAISVLDRETGERRPGTFDDWLEATRLTDALDEIGIYWDMIERSDCGRYVRLTWSPTGGTLFGNFLQTHSGFGFGSPCAGALVSRSPAGGLRRQGGHPSPAPAGRSSLCPQSPLIIDEKSTDAYLELLGWDIPLAVMPMPLMGVYGPR